MASASVNVSLVGRTTVSFTCSYTLPDATSTKRYRFKAGTVYTADDEYTMSSGTTSGSCDYTPGGTGSTIDTIYIYVTYEEDSWGKTGGGYYTAWVFQGYTAETTVWYPDYNTDTTRYTHYSTRNEFNEDGTIKETYYVFSLETRSYIPPTYGWLNNWTYSGALSSSDTFYVAPISFSFNNCVSGKQWKVEEGINSLITNLTSFQAQAQQWKAWKNQKSQSACPSFDSPISASQLNSIYTYLGSSGGYKAGDEVSAAMFNRLADIINA